MLVLLLVNFNHFLLIKYFESSIQWTGTENQSLIFATCDQLTQSHNNKAFFQVIDQLFDSLPHFFPFRNQILESHSHNTKGDQKYGQQLFPHKSIENAFSANNTFKLTPNILSVHIHTKQKTELTFLVASQFSLSSHKKKEKTN